MDAACECFRYSAASVTIIYVQKHSAFGKELQQGIALGTRVLFPQFIESYEHGIVRFWNGEEVEADLLIEAVGEFPGMDFVGEKLDVQYGFYMTNLPYRYIIGEAAAPGLLTHFIAIGKKTALRIPRILQGLLPEKKWEVVVDNRKVNIVYFQEKESLYSVLDACFSCGTCLQCDICVENCPRCAIERKCESFKV